MMSKARFLIASFVVVALAAGYLAGQQPAGGTDNSADEAAVRQAGQGFLKAYLAGDAKAMAAYWTENGEYISDDGTTIRGRQNIEKAYAELFAKKGGYTDAEIDVTSIRFPSKDTAIEEGRFRVRSVKEGPTTSKYSVLHVREGGKWHMAIVREWPSSGTALRDLDWLIGTWEAKNGDTEVRTTYEWWGDKHFMRVHIMLKQKTGVREGLQMIGKDPATGQIRSWTFDKLGSFGAATWTREGNKWMQDSAGVMEDGDVLAATNIMTRIDNDTFTFQSVQRSLDGEEIEDVPPVRVTRVKAK